MKNFFTTLLLFIILYSFLITFNFSYASSPINFNIFDKPKLAETVENNELNILSKRAIIYERNSQSLLFQKNAFDIVPMASTTKIMTAIIVLENANLSDIVTVSKKSANTGGSRLGLHANDNITVHDLLYGLMLCSGNDAAVALAEHIGGNYQSFITLMNQKSISLGLSNTHFESPHGLDSPHHFTTAYELAKITDYALRLDKFRTIIETKKHTIYINNIPKLISNTNELLGYPNVYGVKTGYTGKAGRCLVTSAKNNVLDIIVIVLGADTKSIRTSDSKKLINFAFKNYTILDLKPYILEEYLKIKQDFQNIFIEKSNDKNITTTLLLSDNFLYAIPINTIPNITIKSTSYLPSKHLKSPLKTVGAITSYLNNTPVVSVKIITKGTIKYRNLIDYFLYFIKNFKNIINNIKF